MTEKGGGIGLDWIIIGELRPAIYSIGFTQAKAFFCIHMYGEYISFLTHP